VAPPPGTVLARDTAGNTGRTQLSITATDNRAPVVTILSNGPSTVAGAIQMAGTASDDFGIASVSWRTSRGAAGLAVGTASWMVASIPVQQGSNEITITATDKAGNSGTSVLKINGNRVRGSTTTNNTTTTSTTTTTAAGGTSSALTETSTPSTTSGAGLSAPTPAGAVQSVPALPAPALPLPPGLTILPTVMNGPWVTSAGTVPLKGTATDNVTRVTWSVGWGGSGTASGTQAWTIPTIGLQIGTNVITVTATTADGRVARQTVTVTYRPRGNSR
jgi:hypothetical protein